MSDPTTDSNGVDRTAVTVGLSPKATRRLDEALPGWTLVDDAPTGDDEAAAAPAGHLGVLSSRLDPDSAAAAMARFRDTIDGPIVIITHPGGEDATVELLAAGATLAIPEGRENRIAGLFADASMANDLVDAYVTWAGSSAPRRAALQVDEHAGVAGALAFDDALAEAAASPTPPRVVVLSARDLGAALAGMNSGIANLLRRRIAQEIQNAVRPLGGEVFALDELRFATLLPAEDGILDAVVEPLRQSIESYAPVRGRSLRLGLGHAGPEDTNDASILRDLAERACAIAVETGRRVVSASELVEAVADRTNLLTLLGAVEALERRQPETIGHAARVSDLAAAIGTQLGLDETDRGRLATAARFHDVGKLGLPPTALDGPDGLEGDDLTAWRSHVDRSARALTPVAGTIVATIVRHHHELVDGSGFPDGLAGEMIPLASRIIAVADAFDIALTRRDADGLDFDVALRGIIDEAGSKWDRAVVDGLVDLVQRRRLPHSVTG